MWFPIAISAYFLFALVTLTDKYLLRSAIPDPRVFSFWVGMLSLMTLVFIPLGFTFPGFWKVILSLLAGGIFIFALFIFYSGLKVGEASRVGTVVGGLTPFFIFGLSYFASFFGGEKFFLPTKIEILALFALVLGGVFISWESQMRKISLKVLGLGIFASFLFAAFFVLAKFVYSLQPFFSGFIWMKIGGFLAAFIFLFSIKVRQSFFRALKNFLGKERVGIGGKKISVIFVSKQATGGIAGVLQHYAISLAKFGGQVSLVNALQGSQYLFLLVFVFILTKKFPRILKEEFARPVFLQKVLGILLIGAGIFALAVFSS